MYRTGDLARRRGDGVLEFQGHNDAQVKLRGFRIELGEIESQLTRQPGVQEALVTLREDASGERRLVAYLVGTAADALPSAAELRAALARELPDYMLPRLIQLLPVLPLTANGKLDRRALPPPDHADFARRAYAPPRGEKHKGSITTRAGRESEDRKKEKRRYAV